MNIVIGTIIVIVTVYYLFKDYDIRMTLIASGLLMAGIALDPLTVLDEFAQRMVTDSLIQAVCSVIGFAFVMRETRCESHLLQLISRRLKGFGFITIPAVTLITFGINSVLLSAANTTAAVGVIFVPLLIATGVHPAVAATAVLAGTFGSMLSPLLPINSFVARVSGVDVGLVIEVQSLSVVLAVSIAAACLTLIAIVRNEHKDYSAAPAEDEALTEKVNPLFVIIPVVPLVILVLGASGLVPTLQMGIAQAMLVGTLLGLVVTRTSPVTITTRFFDGMGAAYGNTMGIIIAVSVFVRGMKSIGLISFFITWLTTTPELARVGGVLGPFLLGIMSGSGDAAAFAFSEAVAPHAFHYGMETVNMGSMAAMAGALGRTMSPLAGAAIVCASIAQVNPLELAKRNAPGMSVALSVIFFIL